MKKKMRVTGGMFQGIAAAALGIALLTGCGGAETAAPAGTAASVDTAAAGGEADTATEAAGTSADTAAGTETSAGAERQAGVSGSADGSRSKALEGVERKGRLKKIIENGYITMATEPYFAPYEFIDSSRQGDAQYVGADIEFGKYIADALGVELRVVPLEFSAVLSSVPDGKYDIAISGLAYTPERAEAMELSDGYYFSDDNKGYSLLIQEKDKDSIKTPEDLKGKTIVYQSGSLQEALSKEQVDEAACKEVKRTSSSNDAYLTVQEGKADAAVVSVESAGLYAAANPGLYIVEDFRFDFPKELDGTRVGTQKGEKELMAVINSCIAELRESGQMDRWIEEYEEYAKTLGLE